MIVGAVINGRLGNYRMVCAPSSFAHLLRHRSRRTPTAFASWAAFASGGKQAGCRPSTAAAKVNPPGRAVTSGRRSPPLPR